MINIQDKKDCCGCAACVQRCPKQCISLQEDSEGFLYPKVDTSLCIDCGLCEKVCPIIHQADERTPLGVYAAKNPDEAVRMQSSSGGVFTMLAERVLAEGGVVFGARWDEHWEVVHDYVETKEGLAQFRGSKYVQSKIGRTFQQAESFLKQGRPVLFSGTPCQIAGLKNYLRKEYDNLLAVEVVCHGVPSPAVWKSYLLYVNPAHQSITKINLRDKSRGWKKYSYLIESSTAKFVNDYASSSLYLKGFSLNLTLRPSCYKCPAKSLKSGADITLADCWGEDNIKDYQDDDKGLSAVLINTGKADNLFKLLNFDTNICLSYDFVVKYNPSIGSSSKRPYIRNQFWKLFPTYGIKGVEIITRKLGNPVYRLINKLRTKSFK